MLHLLCVDHDMLHPKQKNNQPLKMKAYKLILQFLTNTHKQETLNLTTRNFLFMLLITADIKSQTI